MGPQLGAGICLHPRQYGQVKIPFRRIVGRASMAAALAATLPLAFAAPAQAAVESDQSQPSGVARESYEVMAQTFTAGKTGRLDHVVLRLVSIGAAAKVSIRHLNPDGTPGATDINNASATMSGYFSGYPSFDFSKQNVPLTAGDKYAIVNTTV